MTAKREPFGRNTEHRSSVETARLLGLSLLRKGDWDGAAAQFHLVVALAPEDTATHNNLCIALRNLGKREAAVRAFEAAIERRPDYLSARYNLGTTLGELGRSNQALDQFAAIVRLAPENVDARFALGEMLIETGDPASVARHLGTYLSLDPTDRFGAAMKLARIGLAPLPLKCLVPACDGWVER
jgi:predicted TPR repeat methyltransferase